MDKGEQVMAGLWDLFNKRTWLDGVKMKESMKGYTPSEIHAVAYIGEHADSNVTKLADAFFMTRSAISKLTRKLVEKELVESYQRPDNKKEIYFRLTGKGTALNAIHAGLHTEYAERDRAVFEEISDAQYNCVLEFIKLYDRHLQAEIERLGAQNTAGYMDRL